MRSQSLIRNSVVRWSLAFFVLLIAWSPAFSDPCPVGKWQFDANGYFGTLDIRDNSVNCVGTVEFDLWDGAEALGNIAVNDGIIRFTRPRGNQTHIGHIRGDRMMGTFAMPGNVTYPFISMATAAAGVVGTFDTYPWEARRMPSNQDDKEGLVELGDRNGDGAINNKDVVDFIRGFGIGFTTYQVCDEEYNPGCAGLLSEHTSPFAIIPKAFAPELHRTYGIDATAFPVERLPSIREMAKALLDFPADVSGPVIRDRWTIQVAGHVARRGQVARRWRITGSGGPGYLILWPNGPYAKVLFRNAPDGSALVGQPWELLRNLRRSGDRVTFDRMLPGGVVQSHEGRITGPASAGVLGNAIEGTFTDGWGSYSWRATGTIRQSGASELSLTANNYSGTLTLSLDASYSGRFRPGDELENSSRPLLPAVNLVVEELGGIKTISFEAEGNHYRGTLALGETANVDMLSGVVAIGGRIGVSGVPGTWSASPVEDWGGTAAPGCIDTRPVFNIGTLCDGLYLRTQTERKSIFHEFIGHPLEWALAAGQPPFGLREWIDYVSERVFRRSGPVMTGRPTGFISGYATNDATHDFVETLSYFTQDPVNLWNTALLDAGRGDLRLWNKQEYIRREIFRQQPISTSSWNFNSNDFSGTMTLLLDAPGIAVPSGVTVRTPCGNVEFGGVHDPLSHIHFNGRTVRFIRRLAGGDLQDYVGVLRPNGELEGLFTHQGLVFPWRASRPASPATVVVPGRLPGCY